MGMLIASLGGSRVRQLIRLSSFQIVSILHTFALALLVAGCASTLEKSADFDRHRYSQLVQPFDRRGQIYFDVVFNAAYPADDPVADAKRTAWLGAWLAQKRLCAGGHAVTTRRPFEYLEDNPAGFQQRWEIRCQTVPGRQG